MASLPIVDISPFLSESATAEHKIKSATDLFKACHDVGFFYLTGHGIPQETLDLVLDTTRKWFLEASDEQKSMIARKDPGMEGDGARGYQRIGENVTMGKSDYHEAIDLYATHPDTPSSPPYKPLMGINKWPSAEYEGIFTEYINVVLELGSALMRCMALAFNLPEDYFEEYIDPSFWVCRAIGYPPLTRETMEKNTGGVSCGAHADYGCWTFLLADETKGALKVLEKNGETWIDANPIKGAYVVNVGDMLMAWTNGLFKSTIHKVVHLGSNYRVSVPVFFEPRFDAKIAPLDVCIQRTGGKAKYEEQVYGSYLYGKVANNFGSYGAPEKQ